MLEQERHDTILRLLRRNRIVTIHDVVSVLGVSEATARRDFAELDARKLIERIRGGAKLAASGGEPAVADGTIDGDRGGNLAHFDESPFELRRNINIQVKRKIAKQAVMLCRDGDTIIIDGGSTTFQMAEFLPALHLQVLTNSFAIAQYLVKHSQCRVILPEGMVYSDSQLILSPFRDDIFKHYFAEKCFMGAEAIDEMGAANTNSMLIHAEHSMIEHSRDLVLLVDSSKFRRHGHLRLCTFKQIDTIVTDTGISEEDRKMVESHGVNLVIV